MEIVVNPTLVSMVTALMECYPTHVTVMLVTWDTTVKVGCLHGNDKHFLFKIWGTAMLHSVSRCGRIVVIPSTV